MSQRTPFPHPRILVPSAGAALRSAAATAIIVALTSALPIAAEAQYRGPRADPEVARGDLPNTFTERPLTLPKLTMRWTLGAQAFRVDPGGGADEDYFVLAGGGFAFGILDELELGVGAGPISPFFADGGEIAGLSLSVYPTDDIDFQPPFAYLRARLVGSSGFELGVDGGFIAPVNGADPTIVVSLPMRIRGGQSFALDANFGATMAIAGGVDTTLYGTISPRFASPVFYFSVTTGFVMSLDNVDQTIMPLYAEVTITADPGRHLVDIFLRGGMPRFLQPGASGDKIDLDVIEAQLGLRLFFDLDC